MDRRREQEVNEAAARFAETLADSYRIVYEQAAEAQQRQGRLAPEFSARAMDHLREPAEGAAAAAQRRAGRRAQGASGRGTDHRREQAEGGRAASEQLADQARRQQEAGRALAQEPAKAYMDFLNTAPPPAREGTEGAAGSAQETARTL